MPCIGYDCPLDGKVATLKDCVVCPSPCLELPLLFAMMMDNVYWAPADRISITELEKPPLQAALERKYEFTIKPLDRVWMVYGQAFHSLIERQRERMAGYDRKDLDYTFEKANKFQKPLTVGGRTVTVVGTPDQYQRSTRTLTDYKTMKAGDVYYLQGGKPMKDNDYAWQVNRYDVFGFPEGEVQHLQLVGLIRDFNRKVHEKKGIKPFMRFAIPKFDRAEVISRTEAQVKELLVAFDDIKKARGCTSEERWAKNVRCHEWCPCNSHCPFFSDEAPAEDPADADIKTPF